MQAPAFLGWGGGWRRVAGGGIPCLHLQVIPMTNFASFILRFDIGQA